MNKAHSPSQIIELSIQGQIESLDQLLEYSHAQLLEASLRLSPSERTLTKKNLYRLLIEFQKGQFSDTKIQLWATWIRHGFLPNHGAGPIKPVDIEYESEHEELINEVTLRLEELGEVVDGEISSNELSAMISQLK